MADYTLTIYKNSSNICVWCALLDSDKKEIDVGAQFGSELHYDLTESQKTAIAYVLYNNDYYIINNLSSYSSISIDLDNYEIEQNPTGAIYLGDDVPTKIYLGTTLVMEQKTAYYNKQYFTFEILTSGTITWNLSDASGTAKTISYKKNNGSWTNITSTTSGASINVNNGDIIKFKGSNTTYGTSSTDYNCFGGTATFNVYGNIMSLIGGDTFDTLKTLSSSYTFYALFKDSNIINADNLILPATTLSAYCYMYMFYGCTNLASATFDLPATTLTDYCYGGLFRGCTSITNGPDLLPATILTMCCYAYMYYGCTALTSCPKFAQASTTAGAVLYSTFEGCTSLTSTSNYNNVIQYANTKTYNWYIANRTFYGCTSLTDIYPINFYLNPTYMFYGCTSLTEATIDMSIPPGGLYNSSTSGINYYTNYNNIYLFTNCSNLNKVIIRGHGWTIGGMPSSLNDMCSNWLSGASNSGTMVSINADWFINKMSTNSVSGIPSGWTTTTQ